ncbi:uncharacterized protein N0V89_002725 [Didymosphaeria variabile]|uniref:Uncharacterized protein n=1 Tax=Didymosphaeria variabile TaxID=1932322 RepID=A0A9W9CDV6_9PLEO|nr:uncharacterized protein N0V89_002725 [Didymosphaeria variabile]KAJ4358146.1 hypothetical protein N0V89_002725 [Didymosphaeria variabile]
MTDRDFNDERLQKAIQYLVTEGSGDPIELYIARIQAIDEHILQQLPAQGKSFDPSLYRRLRSLTREVQDDVQAIHQEESSLDFNSDSSIEALYKGMDVDNELEVHGVDVSAAAPSIILDKDERTVVASSSAPRPIIKTMKTLDSSKAPSKDKEQVRFSGNVRTSIDDDVIEKCFLYGGPNNDPEVWYKDLPPILSIGETPYTEKWESAKINYDLVGYWGRSPKKLEGPRDFERTDIYDSGSQYKLPAGRSYAWSRNEEEHARIQGLWPSILRAFNNGLQDSDAQQGDKKYAPRMILPLVSEVFIKPFTKLTRASSGQASEGRRISEGKGKWEVPVIEVPNEGLHTHSQRSRWESSSYSRPRLPETNLRKFNSKREAAARRDKSETLSPREKAVLRTRAALATTPTPETRATARPSAGPTLVKRKQDRTPNKPQDPSYPPRHKSHDAELPTILDYSTLKEDTNDLVNAEPARRKRVRPASKPHDPSYHPPRRQSQDVSSPTTPDRSTLEAEIDDLNDPGSAKRPHKRSHKGSTDPSYRPGQSPVTPTKRKRDENLDFKESSKKAKKLRGTKKKSPVSSSHVEFAGEEPEPATKATPSKKATPTKSAIKKPKRISAEDRELASTMTFDRRGKTRSNKDYKPKRLRSRDDTA